MDEGQPPKIRIAQIFLERAAFSHREDFLAFPANTATVPEVEIKLEVGLSADGDRGRIQVNARSKPGADELYNFDLLMTALIEREGEGNMPLHRYLASNAGALVFPFLREAVANLTGRGRFGPIWIHPVNLLALTSGEQKTSESLLPLPDPAKPRVAVKRARKRATRKRD